MSDNNDKTSATPMVWLLEDETGRELPHGPFASLMEAQAAATEIGVGIPVHRIDQSHNAHPDFTTKEPQEWTLKSVLCEEG